MKAKYPANPDVTISIDYPPDTFQISTNLHFPAEWKWHLNSLTPVQRDSPKLHIKVTVAKPAPIDMSVNVEGGSQQLDLDGSTGGYRK